MATRQEADLEMYHSAIKALQNRIYDLIARQDSMLTSIEVMRLNARDAGIDLNAANIGASRRRTEIASMTRKGESDQREIDKLQKKIDTLDARLTRVLRDRVAEGPYEKIGLDKVEPVLSATEIRARIKATEKRISVMRKWSGNENEIKKNQKELAELRSSLETSESITKQSDSGVSPLDLVDLTGLPPQPEMDSPAPVMVTRELNRTDQDYGVSRLDRITKLQEEIQMRLRQISEAEANPTMSLLGHVKARWMKDIDRIQDELDRLLDEEAAERATQVDDLTTQQIEEKPKPLSPEKIRKKQEEESVAAREKREKDSANVIGMIQKKIDIKNAEIQQIYLELSNISDPQSTKYRALDARLKVANAKKIELSLELAAAWQGAEGADNFPTRSANIIKLPPFKDNGPTVFSGCDIVPVITTENKVIELGNISTLSYSTHRDKFPVRTLGRTYPKSYSRGGRTIAGTMVWTVFDNHALAQLAEIYTHESGSDDTMTTVVPDQLPPFDITVTYFSEVPNTDSIVSGNTQYKFKGAVMRLYGVEIVDEGQTHGVNDLYIENVMQFVARDIEHMSPIEDTPGTNFRVTPFKAGVFTGAIFADPLLVNLGSTVDVQTESLTTLEAKKRNLEFYLGNLDGDWTLKEVISELAREGIQITNRAELSDLLDATIIEITQLKTQLEEVEQRRDTRKTEIRYKTITDPSRNFRDNPFDLFTPRTL